MWAGGCRAYFLMSIWIMPRVVNTHRHRALQMLHVWNDCCMWPHADATWACDTPGHPCCQQCWLVWAGKQVHVSGHGTCALACTPTHTVFHSMLVRPPLPRALALHPVLRRRPASSASFCPHVPMAPARAMRVTATAAVDTTAVCMAHAHAWQGPKLAHPLRGGVATMHLHGHKIFCIFNVSCRCTAVVQPLS